MSTLEVPARSNVLRDEIIRLTGPKTRRNVRKSCAASSSGTRKTQREIVLLTNLFHLAASTVAGIYKERWQIELFFKALKQNLQGQDLCGHRENAVQTQIWTALIAMLLLKFMQLKVKFGWSLSNLAAMLRFNLLTYRDLWAWLDEPLKVPRLEALENQMELIAS